MGNVLKGAELPLEEYYHDIWYGMLFSRKYDKLGGKAESGEETSHAYTVHIVESDCRYLAVTLGYEAEKAQLLARLKGLNFAPFGAAGMTWIKEKAVTEGFTVNEAEICLAITQEVLDELKMELRPELREAIARMYSPNVERGEEALVNLCYSMFQDMYLLEMSDVEISTIFRMVVKDEIEEETRKQGRICGSESLRQMVRENAPLYQLPPLTKEEQQLLDGLWAYYKERGHEGPELAQKVIMSMEKIPVR